MTTPPDAAERAASIIRDQININPHGPFNEHAAHTWADIIRREYAADLERLMVERDDTDILNAGAQALARTLLSDDGHSEMSPGPCADALALVRRLKAEISTGMNEWRAVMREKAAVHSSYAETLLELDTIKTERDAARAEIERVNDDRYQLSQELTAQMEETKAARADAERLGALLNQSLPALNGSPLLVLGNGNSQDGMRLMKDIHSALAAHRAQVTP